MRVQEASADESDAEEQEGLVDAAELLNSTDAEVPPFLRDSEKQNSDQFTFQNADEVAELIAAAPGPLGQELAAEDWYDAVIHGYLVSSWKAHAHQTVQDLKSVVTVRFPSPQQPLTRSAQHVQMRALACTCDAKCKFVLGELHMPSQQR